MDDGWLELNEIFSGNFIPVEHWAEVEGHPTRDLPPKPQPPTPPPSFPSKATAVSLSLDLPVASGQQHRQQ